MKTETQTETIKSLRCAFAVATEADAESIAAIRTAAAQQLTAEYGRGHWSSASSTRSVARDLQLSTVLVARDGPAILGTLALTRKKPWAIDPVYFTPVTRALYLISMAVHPNSQRCGIGNRLVEAAKDMAGNWQYHAVRLDAYDAPAGAGEFYLKCGFHEVGRVTYRGTPLIYFEFLL